MKRFIALAGITLFLSLNACRTCNCPAYSEEYKPTLVPSMEENSTPVPRMKERYFAMAESGNKSIMPGNIYYN